jgi:hypothetical protein
VVYDGPLSHDVAFGPLLQDAVLWRDRLVSEAKEKDLVSLATDGETWGHHHKFGEMALAAVLDQMGRRPGVRVENFASFLARQPARESLEVVSPSSWSCPHGVERWRSDCSCKTAPHLPTQQEWRAPLRVSFDWLAGELRELFMEEGTAFWRDPLAARDEQGPVGDAEDAGEIRGRELLELERNALAMFTSCGWFFDDVGGVETVVVLRHAARAIELSGAHADRLEAGLLERLAPALSNDPVVGDAAKLYRAQVRKSQPAPLRAGAGYAAARLVGSGMDDQLAGYSLATPAGANGDIAVTDRRTGARTQVAVAVERPSLCRISVGAAIGARPVPLEYSELPEKHRLLVQRALTRAVVEFWFTHAERDLLASGAESLETLAGGALTRALGDLVNDQSENAVHRAHDLLDLVEQMGLGIPFDAQTAFARAREGAAGPFRHRIDVLGPRLGFVA